MRIKYIYFDFAGTGSTCFLSSFTVSFRHPFTLSFYCSALPDPGRFCSVQMFLCFCSDFLLCRNGLQDQTWSSGSVRRKAEGIVSGFCMVLPLKSRSRWKVTLANSWEGESTFLVWGIFKVLFIFWTLCRRIPYWHIVHSSTTAACVLSGSFGSFHILCSFEMHSGFPCTFSTFCWYLRVHWGNHRTS